MGRTAGAALSTDSVDARYAHSKVGGLPLKQTEFAVIETAAATPKFDLE